MKKTFYFSYRSINLPVLFYLFAEIVHQVEGGTPAQRVSSVILYVWNKDVST